MVVSKTLKSVKMGKPITATNKRKTKSPSSLTVQKKRVTADDLKWKSVKTSHLPGMDEGGGMMMLEELDGVGVEWEEGDGGRKKARFVASDDMVEEGAGGSYKGDENALDDEEEWSGIQDPVFTDEAGQSGPSSTVALDIGGEAEEAEEDDEMVDDDEEVDDLSEEVDSDGPNEEGVIEPEPDFDDDLLPEWKAVSLHTSLKRALLALGFAKPTEIQGRSLPLALMGRDIVGVAETGSGKTLAYSLPILSHLLRSPFMSSTKRPLSALILCPTRELALQVTEHLGKVVKQATSSPSAEEDDDKTDGLDESRSSSKGKGKGKAVANISGAGPPRISIGSVIGGLSAQKQKRIVDRGCDILVATPGRLWDLMKTDDELAAGVRGLRFLVIDEADRMIENGHFVELENIVGLTQRKTTRTANADDDDPTFAEAASLVTVTPANEEMQTFIFSATLSKDLQQNLKRKTWGSKKPKGKRTNALEDLVAKLDFRDLKPEVIDLSPEGGKVATLRESLIECIASDKDLYLYYFLLRYPGRSLVFVGSIDGIRRLIPLFEVLQVPVYPLHSQLQQKQRLKNLDRFKSSPTGVLIATDVAARGLDIPQVDHVIHFNLPRTADAYIHRSGRTARASNPGFALQLCSAEDKGIQRSLMKSLGREETLPDLPIESGFLPKLRERIRVAKAIEKAQHMVKKDNHDKNWLKETAEAMDIDIESDMLSDGSYDADLPFHQPNKGISKRTHKTSSTKLVSLKNELRSLLAEPLMARGVSAKYPTGGSRIIVDDLIKSKMLGQENSGADGQFEKTKTTDHPMMLGAGTTKAYDEVLAPGKVRKVVKKVEVKGRDVRRQEKKDAKKKEKEKRVAESDD